MCMWICKNVSSDTITRDSYRVLNLEFKQCEAFAI